MAMDLNARAAYIRGLMNGLNYEPDSKEGKVLAAMMDLLEDMAAVVNEHDDMIDQIFDELDAIDADMDDLEDGVLDDLYDFNREDADDGDDDALETSYEVTCPNCGTVNIVDEATLLDSDKLVCAECGAAFGIEVLSDDADDAEPSARPQTKEEDGE